MIHKRITMLQFCLIALIAVSKSQAQALTELPLTMVIGDFTLSLPANPAKIASSGNNVVIIWKNGQGLILDLLDQAHLQRSVSPPRKMPLNNVPGQIFSKSKIDPENPWFDFIMQMRPVYINGASEVDSFKNGLVEVFYSNSPARGFTGSAMAVIHRQKDAAYILMIDAKRISFETFKTILGTIRPTTQR